MYCLTNNLKIRGDILMPILRDSFKEWYQDNHEKLKIN